MRIEIRKKLVQRKSKGVDMCNGGINWRDVRRN